ncbi:MAG: DNA mismatch repair protein MutS, partial [candidate division WOR-3 bacterium]
MTARLTPLLEQYRRIKEQHKDAILLFRVGDFYETFYEDAPVVAQALDLVLTSRPHGPGNDVPLAGVPARSLDTYVARLVAKGFKVAVCDQLEEPSGGRNIFHREVVEVITPGTVTRPGLVPERRNNYLVALSPAGEICGIAFVDVSTGEFGVGEVQTDQLGEEVRRLSVGEVLLARSVHMDSLPPNLPITRLDDYYFTQDFAFDRLASHFGVATLNGFGVGEMTEGICAAGAALAYLEQTQRSRLSHLRRLIPYRSTEYLYLDEFSRRNLELVERIRPEDQSSRVPATLLGVLDRTRTPAGARLLRRWVLNPLLSVSLIRERQDAVSELVRAGSPLNTLQETLGVIADIERVASRIALERANPRELISLRNWLTTAPRIRSQLADCSSRLLQRLQGGIGDYQSMVDAISRTLVDDPPLATNEGGLIRSGVSNELDELRQAAAGAKDFIARLQAQERERTGIPNLRIRYNSVFGYFIEVTKSWLHRVPETYVRRQTVLNAERFVTPELKEYEARVLNSEERITALEQEIFLELRRRLAVEVEQLLDFSRIVAELDAVCSLAEVARLRRYVRPEVDDSTAIEIKAGRHPVVEAVMSEPFVPNDTRLDTESQQILIITGPNMAGKSTYLRQTALITIMAQVGSFVPADSARIGVVDRIFTRIGASDDLARGVSTFLAEMTETANILNNATDRSLVILDEVGRGTSTNDGLAIAWATVEYLHGEVMAERGRPAPKTLFATHYRELTDLPS